MFIEFSDILKAVEDSKFSEFEKLALKLLIAICLNASTTKRYGIIHELILKLRK